MLEHITPLINKETPPQEIKEAKMKFQNGFKSHIANDLLVSYSILETAAEKQARDQLYEEEAKKQNIDFIKELEIWNKFITEEPQTSPISSTNKEDIK